MRFLFVMFDFIGMIMVVVGFKLKMTAVFMVAILSLGNIFLNNWWSLHQYVKLLRIILVIIQREIIKDMIFFRFYRLLAVYSY